MNNRDVCLVGAGAVNLISAWFLQARGYNLHILDAGPDPALQREGRGATWSGASVRMFTYTEAENHNNKDRQDQAGARVFREPLTEMGWDLRASRVGEEQWIRAHENVPRDQAEQYNRDILSFNLESAPLWSAMMQRSPELFDDASVREGIIRLFSHAPHYQDQVARHRALGSLLTTYEPVERLLQDAPGLSAAIESGVLSGAFKTVGFSLNARRFLRNTIDLLQEGGAEFFWDEEVTSIQRDAHGRIKSLLSNRRDLAADHFVLSLGAFGNKLLRETHSGGLICGVLGAWASIPNPDSMFVHSMKIARKGHVTEDANVIVAEDDGQSILVVGSGYGFTGRDPGNIDPVQLDRMHQGIEDTIQHFFPAAYGQVRGTTAFARSRSYCVRPWTPCGLGIFEQARTVEGGQFLVTGANNTGGFAQGPAIAGAVVAAIEGRAHPMHHAYRHDRHLQPFAAALK